MKNSIPQTYSLQSRQNSPLARIKSYTARLAHLTAVLGLGLVMAISAGMNAAVASELSVEERAIGVVKGFMHGLETGNAELCMNLLDTPYYQDAGAIMSAAELRVLVEKTVKGNKDIGLVEYSIQADGTTVKDKLGQAYIDVLAKSRDDAILFRVKASDVFKIVGLVSGR